MLPPDLSAEALLDAAEAEQLLLEAEIAEAASPGSELARPATTFPSVPQHTAKPEELPVAAAVQAMARTNWCHICSVNAHVWCVDCGDEAFCADCWRTTHAQSWSSTEVRRHRTVPCSGARLEATMPSAPSQTPQREAPAGSAPDGCAQREKQVCKATSASARPDASIASSAGHLVPTCHGCRKCAAHVWCSDCEDTAYCAKCWREIHSLLPEMRRHRVVKVRVPTGRAPP